MRGMGGYDMGMGARGRGGMGMGMGGGFGGGMGGGGFGGGYGGGYGAAGGYGAGVAAGGYGDTTGYGASYETAASGYGSNGAAAGGKPYSFNSDSNMSNPGYSQFGVSVLVKMRGLPFSANLNDINEFFAGTAKVIDVDINYGPDGRPAGTADVLFGSMEDAKAAMTKNRANMSSRYIELFLEGPV